jgi:hypothetical protein
MRIFYGATSRTLCLPVTIRLKKEGRSENVFEHLFPAHTPYANGSIIRLQCANDVVPNLEFRI